MDHFNERIARQVLVVLGEIHEIVERMFAQSPGCLELRKTLGRLDRSQSQLRRALEKGRRNDLQKGISAKLARVGESPMVVSGTKGDIDVRAQRWIRLIPLIVPPLVALLSKSCGDD